MNSLKHPLAYLITLFIVIVGFGCADSSSTLEAATSDEPTRKVADQPVVQNKIRVEPDSVDYDDIVLAGGCFWCVEADLEKLEGVVEVISGYSGGELEEPTYQNYAKGGHREVVRAIYNPEIVSLEELLTYFMKHIDPTDSKGQFVDRGEYYSPAIYYQTVEEKELAEKVIKKIENKNVFEEPIVVPIQPQEIFWPAEEYHQDFYKKKPGRYNSYRSGSGREEFYPKHWE